MDAEVSSGRKKTQAKEKMKFVGVEKWMQSEAADWLKRAQQEDDDK